MHGVGAAENIEFPGIDFLAAQQHGVMGGPVEDRIVPLCAVNADRPIVAANSELVSADGLGQAIRIFVDISDRPDRFRPDHQPVRIVPIRHLSEQPEQFGRDDAAAEIVVGAPGVAEIAGNQNFGLDLAGQVIFAHAKEALVVFGINFNLVFPRLQALQHVVRHA